MAFPFLHFTDRLPVPWIPFILLILSILYLIWGLSRTSRRRPSKRQTFAPDNLTERVHRNTNGGGNKDEISIPFEMAEVRVSKILVHPIKSCRGTSVSEVHYTPQGLENDRKWCITDAKTHTILTARELPTMVLITPRLEPDLTSPHGGQLVVSFPTGSECDAFSVLIKPSLDILGGWKVVKDCTMFGEFVMDGYVCEALPPSSLSPSDILSKYLSRPVHLMMKGPQPRACPPTMAFPTLKATTKFQDGYPLLVASEESLAEVEKMVREAAMRANDQEGRIGGLDQARWLKGGLAIERFRPNIVLKGAGVPFAEDMWREIVVSPKPEPNPNAAPSAKTITLVSKCTRCLLPNVDINTGTRDAAVPYKILMRFRTGKDPERMNKPCFGCNGFYGGEGVVRVGDYVTVKTWAGAGGV
ncbi:hypothetical protein AcW1_001444 [Taiwanofungus camphoratus]|nr:hypothetical protein AcW2_000024 [Antrodia cinnamomea]KAI0964676.1 hypothetical protein AcW1_001444 [Antrodia cinnamomea]